MDTNFWKWGSLLIILGSFHLISNSIFFFLFPNGNIKHSPLPRLWQICLIWDLLIQRDMQKFRYLTSARGSMLWNIVRFLYIALLNLKWFGSADCDTIYTIYLHTHFIKPNQCISKLDFGKVLCNELYIALLNWKLNQNWKCFVLFLERVSDQLIVTLYTLSIYPFVHKQLIRTIFKAHIVENIIWKLSVNSEIHEIP